MNKLNDNKVFYLIVGTGTNALFALFFTIISYIFIGKDEFSYLTGLFIFESMLILFDLSINNYIIKYSASENKNTQKKIINFFFKKIIIFCLVFFFFNLFILKEIFWDKIIYQESNLILFITIIVSLIVITRICINFFRAILIGSFQQIKTSKIQIIAAILKFFLFISILFFYNSIKALLISYLAGLFIELLIYSFSVYRKFIANFFIFEKHTIDKLFILSFTDIFLLSTSIIIFVNFDRIFLSYNVKEDILGEYNFIKTILLGFFILGSAYYFNLLPEISKLQKKNFIIKKKIIENFKSLNIILSFCITGSFLFIENFFYDFNLNSLFKFENFSIFKIIIIANYFTMLNQIFLSFQIANSHFKIPTVINYIIIIFSLLIAFPLFNLFGVEGISYLYLSMNFINFFCNLIILSFMHEEIFSKKMVVNFFKIIFFDFVFIFLGLIILYFLFYNLSKLLFYIIFTLLFFYFFYLSQKFLKKNI